MAKIFVISIESRFLTARISLVQTSRDRDNKRRVRAHEKNSGDTVRRLGAITQSFFLCPIKSQHLLDRLLIVRQESVPRGFSAHA